MTLSKEKLLDMYTKLVTVRKLETTLNDLCTTGGIPGTVHTCIGQEAVAVGVCAALRPDDRLTSHHRSGRAHLICKGGDLKRIVAEMYGKTTGYCKGRSGEVHLADVTIGHMGSNGIVGGGLSIATGIALVSKMMGDDRVTVCFFGDGAACQGAFHESLNLATVWNLPIVYVCENNLYAVNTSASTQLSVKDIATRAAGYSMPGIVVDGMDVLAVYEAATKAVERARRKEGPSLLECKTYRFMHHQGGRAIGPTGRPKEEEERWMSRDPLPMFENHLTKTGVLTKNDVARIESETKAKIDEAVVFGRQSPLPAPEDALIGLFA